MPPILKIVPIKAPSLPLKLILDIKVDKEWSCAQPMTIFKGLLIPLLKTNFPSMREQKKEEKA